MSKIQEDKEIVFQPLNESLVDKVWGADQPKQSKEPVFVLGKKFTGETVAEKYNRVGEKMNGSDIMLLSTLDDIAWLTNMRGNDIDFNPVFISYLLFHNKKSHEGYHVDLFIGKDKVTNPIVKAHMQKNNITAYEYDEIFPKLAEYGTLLDNKQILLSEAQITYKVMNQLKKFEFSIINKPNEVAIMKSKKNKV